MGGRVNRNVIAQTQNFSRQGIHLLDALHLIAEKFDAHRLIGPSRKDVYNISSYSKGASLKGQVITGDWMSTSLRRNSLRGHTMPGLTEIS